MSQNDGTLMDEAFVRAYPVATFTVGAHELDARRSPDLGAEHLRGGGHWRHHDRHRPAGRRVPPRERR
ncbi:hypothetical protein [Propioniciclava flava]